MTLIGQVSSLGYVQPIWSLVGLAGVNVHHVLAVFALHGAAPLEFALALGDTLDTHSVIAPPTAHDLTAVCASGGLVAHSACCPQGACCAVHETVIWRVLDIHQLVLGASLEVLVSHHETGPVLVHGHLGGCVVLLPKVVSSPPEVGHGQPAGSQRTGATDPVTLALQLHKALHCHTTAPVVVKVHQCTSIFHHPLSSIYEGLGKFYAVVDVVATSAPVEIASVIAGSPSFMAVTVADL